MIEKKSIVKNKQTLEKKLQIATLATRSFNQTYQTVEVDKNFQATCATNYLKDYLKSNFTSFENYSTNKVIKLN